MQDIYKPAKNELSAGIEIIKEIIDNRNHPLDIIREALSNSCSREVNASYFKITIFHDSNYGWSLIFEDDGIGMEYTGSRDPEKAGRLDRFLNLSYNGVEGHEADEFGFKGLGSKLMYFCRKLDIETKPRDGYSFKIVVNEPYDKLIKHKRLVSPKPVIFKNIPVGFDNGTVITLFGYDGGRKYPEYADPERLMNYLFFRTLIGITKPERLKEGFPKIILKTPAIHDKEIAAGFPWISKEDTQVEGQKIGTVTRPVVVNKKNKSGDEVTITLRGGYASKTEEFDMADGGVLESKGVGLIYSRKGIPCFNLDFDLYKPKGFALSYKQCRFVVECDDVEMDMAISRIASSRAEKQLFEAAVKEAFKQIMETDDYKDWIQFLSAREDREVSETLNQRKKQLLGKDQKWVYYKDNLIYKEPENEQDVHVLLWKLEGMDVIPLHHFRTLEHTSQREIDIIAEYQEKDSSEIREFISVEVEYIMENYTDHNYVAGQTSLIIAWDSKNRNELICTDEKWKYIWKYLDVSIEVILLKYIPFLEVKTRSG